MTVMRRHQREVLVDHAEAGGDGVPRASRTRPPGRRRGCCPRPAGTGRPGCSSACSCPRRSRPAARGPRRGRRSKSTWSLATKPGEPLDDAPHARPRAAGHSRTGSRGSAAFTSRSRAVPRQDDGRNDAAPRRQVVLRGALSCSSWRQLGGDAVGPPVHADVHSLPGAPGGNWSRSDWTSCAPAARIRCRVVLHRPGEHVEAVELARLASWPGCPSPAGRPQRAGRRCPVRRLAVHEPEEAHGPESASKYS